MTTSSHGTRRNEVVQRQRVKGTEHTPWTLNSLIDRLGQRISHVGIVVGGPSILDVVLCLELLEALHASIVDILSIGNEL